jgi:hypothetical protein
MHFTEFIRDADINYTHLLPFVATKNVSIFAKTSLRRQNHPQLRTILSWEKIQRNGQYQKGLTAGTQDRQLKFRGKL